MSAVMKDAAPAKTLVSLRNLNKHYGDFAAVDNINRRSGRRVPDLPRLQRLGQVHHPVHAGRLRDPSSGEIRWTANRW